MISYEYQICNRCVLDTSDPEIVFDDDGNCNHCRDYVERIAKLVYQGQESDVKLASLVETIKQAGKSREYDCVVGVSGGIDSSYVALLCKRLGLRALAVHMDNGWDSEEAVNNIKKLCKQLGMDYQSYVLNWEEFRDVQLAVLRASIPEVEIPTDVAIQAALHQVAAANGIKYIISGGNYATEGLLPESWFYNPKDARLLKAIHRRFGSKKMKTFPLFDYKREIYYKFVKGIRIVYFLNYVPYAKNAAMQTLEQELDWKYYGGKHYESKFTGFVQSYIQPVKFNLDYRRATFSTEICSGAMTRDEALEELRKSPYTSESVERESAFLCKKFGISREEFRDILEQPPKTYRDYPNDERKLTFIYDMYRRLF